MDDHRHDDDWRDLPVNSDIRRYADATRRAYTEERQMVVRFAPMLCRCQRWYDWRDPVAPQEDCVIHTTVMFDQRGDWQ